MRAHTKRGRACARPGCKGKLTPGASKYCSKECDRIVARARRAQTRGTVTEREATHDVAPSAYSWWIGATREQFAAIVKSQQDEREARLRAVRNF